MRPRPVMWVMGTLSVVAIAAARAWPTDHAQRFLREGSRFGAQRMRYWSHVLDGVNYRLTHGEPDPNVSDEVLLQRVRSELGRLLKLLDLPRLHVDVENHIASLHGCVVDRSEARLIEAQVARISGIDGVESYLTVGLPPDLVRPSEGREQPAESDAHRRLVAAATGSGVPTEVADPVVRAVLGALVDRLPEGEARHLMTHLPEDVRALTGPPRRRGQRPTRERSVADLVRSVLVAAHDSAPEYVDLVSLEKAETSVQAIVGAVRRLVPEEEADVAAVLPPELRQMWLSAPAS